MSAASIVSQIRDRLQSIIERRRSELVVSPDATPDTKAVFAQVIGFVGDLVQLVQSTGADGQAKREAVLAAVGEFYDRVIAPIDLPGPDVVLDPVLRVAVLKLADWSIDGIVALLKSRNMLGAAAP